MKCPKCDAEGTIEAHLTQQSVTDVVSFQPLILDSEDTDTHEEYIDIIKCNAEGCDFRIGTANIPTDFEWT